MTFEEKLRRESATELLYRLTKIDPVSLSTKKSIKRYYEKHFDDGEPLSLAEIRWVEKKAEVYGVKDEPKFKKRSHWIRSEKMVELPRISSPKPWD